jgi:DNA replication and repair protein RecF
MVLMDGSPTERRQFLDRALNQVDREYARSLAVYEQALRRRNKLLMAIREKEESRLALTFWDGLIIKHGQLLQEKRMELIGFINNLWGRSDLFNHLKIEYDKSLISEDRLKQYEIEEVAAGHTLVGPHKDDFRVEAGNETPPRNLGIYGSRGEQRMAVLGLKLGELYFIEDHRPDQAILLLDDIFSELDPPHRSEVLRVMQNRQVVLTSALSGDLELLKDARVIHLKRADQDL